MSRRCASTGSRRSSSARTAPRGSTSASSRLFRSDDRGNTWKPISPDLTRQTDRNTLPVMGRIWSPEAVAQHQSTATWGNISTLSESRKREGLLYVGTDDGLIQFSYDGGGTWRRSERLPGVPDYGNYGVYVQRLYASKNDENVVYALSENSKNGDFKPYVYKSTNRGALVGVDQRRSAGERTGAVVRRRSRQSRTCCSSAPSSACSSPSTAARSGCACAATCRRSRCATWRSRSARTISCSARSAAASTCSTITRRCGSCRKARSIATATSSPPSRR